jgi:type II secretory pathway predicted ATPase ExeA
MYESFYGFSELPFELTANPKYLFLGGRQREALSILQYGLFAAKSITVLIGEAGTGKTTLIRAALESERCRHVRCVYLNNPALGRDEFVRLLAIKFGLGAEAGQSKAVLLEGLERLLRERREHGETTALVVDEAQSLSVELLEEIRLLANIETPSAKLLPLVLAGQPELAERLEDRDLRQLRQRVTLRCELQPFDVKETAAYIARRISAAGAVPSQIFTQEAVMLVHECSRGIPRVISVICDNALVNGMAMEIRPVNRAMVTEVCRDFHLTTRNGQSGAAHLATVDGPTDRSDDMTGEGSVESAENGRQPFETLHRRSRLGAYVSPFRTRTVTHEPN